MANLKNACGTSAGKKQGQGKRFDYSQPQDRQRKGGAKREEEEETGATQGALAN